MNTAKEQILKLIEELPETKAGEVIDFLLYLRSKAEPELLLEAAEEAAIWEAISTEERIPAEKVSKLI
jgi:hypothetical protein